MNASGRRCRQFANGMRHLSPLCGGHIRGGRPVYKATAGLSVAQAIERERAIARRQMAIKTKKKG